MYVPISEPKPEIKSRFVPHRFLLLTIILLQILLVLFFTRPPSTDTSSTSQDPCRNRRIYVYDLPNEFNTDLIEACDRLDPWHSKCVANANSGLGPHASELRGVVPEPILPAWYWTDHYWGEVLYHHRMMGYKCRTLDPTTASAYYLPFYVGLAVGNFLWDNRTSVTKDRICRRALDWVSRQDPFKRSGGTDHFTMLGRLTWDFRRKPESVSEWGSSFLHMEGMRQVIRMSVEKNPWDPLEVAVPYPTIFHPRTDADVEEWKRFVRSRVRARMFSYVGGARKTITNDFRSILESQCRDNKDVCRHVDCSRENCLDGTTAIMSAFLNSDFCLQPRGDGYTRRSVFDCMMAGSIPVFFWNRTAYEQYEWFVPDEPESYSVFIDRSEVRSGKSIRAVLEGYNRERVEKMREKVIEYIPRFIYAKPNEGLENTKDAFDVAIDGIFTKFRDHMESGRLGLRN